MITDAPSILQTIEQLTMAAIVAAGFAFLFTIPRGTHIATTLLGVLGIFVRLILTNNGWSMIGGTFAAASVIGLCSMWLSWRFHSPCVVFSLPAVIPMVPGVFAYRTMLGILEFIRVGVLDQALMVDIISNGLNTAVTFLCLAVGVSLPNLLLRGKSIRRTFGLYKLASSTNEKPKG